MSSEGGQSALWETDQEDRTISDDPATQTGTSGSDDPSGGASASGGGGGVPAGYVSQAALDSAHATIRQLQSERDKANSTLEKLSAERKPEPQPTPSAEAPTLPSPAEYAAAVSAELARRESVREMRSGLSQEFPHADASILSADHASPEEFRAAVEQSHRSRASLIESVRDAAIKEAAQKYGFEIETPQTPPAGDGGSKELTARDIAAMPMSERLKLPAEVFDKALRS